MIECVISASFEAIAAADVSPLLHAYSLCVGNPNAPPAGHLHARIAVYGYTHACRLGGEEASSSIFTPLVKNLTFSYFKKKS